MSFSSSLSYAHVSHLDVVGKFSYEYSSLCTSKSCFALDTTPQFSLEYWRGLTLLNYFLPTHFLRIQFLRLSRSFSGALISVEYLSIVSMASS